MSLRNTNRIKSRPVTLASVGLAAVLLLVPMVPAGTLSGMAISAPAMTTGTTEAWSFSFTPETNVPANGSVRFVLPSGFQASTGAATHCSLTGGDNASIESTQVLSGTEIVCNLGPGGSVGNASQVTFGLSNVQNPRTAHVTGNFTVETRDDNGTVLDTFDGHPVTIAPHAFSSGPTRSNPDLRVDRVTSHTFSFAPFNPWPADGHFIVTFPSGYRFNGAGDGSTQASFSSGGSGELGAPTISGQTLVFQRSAGSVVERGQGVTIEVTAIRNPAQEGPTGPFQVSTANAAVATMDSGQTSSVRISSEGSSTPPPEPEPEPEPTESPEPTPTPTEEPTPTPTPTPTPEDTGSPFDFDDEGNPTNGSREFDVDSGGAAPGAGMVVLLAAAAVALAMARRRRRDA